MEEMNKLVKEPIGKLMAKYSIPMIIAMVVNAIYNVVDRIFIGQFSGEEALASLTIAFPLMMIIFAFASLIGAGGAALLSIKLGEGDKRGASQIFGNTVTIGLITAAILLSAVALNLESLLILFGASEVILGEAVDYMQIILMGFTFQMLSFIFNSMVRNEGSPMLPMTAMLTSAITNMILDYVFIGLMGMGVKGAALATIIGQFLGFCILLNFYVSKKTALHFTLKDFIPHAKTTGNIFVIGFATFIGTIGTSIATMFLNRGLNTYGGISAITAMGAINSLFTLFIMPIMGIQQGIQPIIGYNHGAQQHKRVRRALVDGILVSCGFATVVFALLMIFPEQALSMFISPTSDTLAIAVEGLRYFIAMIPFVSINIMGVAYFQSTANGKVSMLLSMLRQFILLVPIVLILPEYLGLTGVWLATPIADGLSVLISVVVIIIAFRRNRKEDEGLSVGNKMKPVEAVS